MAASDEVGGDVLVGDAELRELLESEAEEVEADLRAEAALKDAIAAKWTKRLEDIRKKGVNWMPDRCYRSLMEAWIEDYMATHTLLPPRETVTAEVLSLMYRFGDEDERDFVVLAYASPAWEK